MPVEVRRATKEDVATIAGLALKLFAQHRDYDRDRFADIGDRDGAENYYGGRIDANAAEVLVADANDRIVGFLYLEYEPIDYAALLEKAAWVHDIYVSDEARGSGAGRMLMEAAKESAARLGAEKIVLSVAAKNMFAQNFFRRAGFRGTMIEMTMNIDKSEPPA